MKTDGKFIIQRGQGITQGIQQEMNLSNQECKQLGSIWTQIINEFEGQTDNQSNMTVYYYNKEETPNSSNNFLVHKDAVIEFSKASWQRIVNLVNDALGKNIEIEDSSSDTEAASSGQTNLSERIAKLPHTQAANSAEPTAKLKQDVEKARDYLTNQLSTLTAADLQTMGITEAKRDRILEYLKNITYDNSHDSAQAKGAGIVFSINCKDTDKLHNMVTLLMHEANHCDENYLDMYPEDSETGDLRHRKSDGSPKTGGENVHSVNTKEEEKACETLGLLTTAVLIKKGVLTGDDNYGRYGGNPPHPVTRYLTDKNLLQSDVENWVSGYTNYPEGINNASLKVEHLKNPKANVPLALRNQKPLELLAGDVIIVGNKSYTLGGDNGIVLSPLDSIPVFQMVPGGNTENELLGDIVFDALPPCEQELNFFDSQNGNDGWIKNHLKGKPEPVVVKRNGEIIYRGKKY